MAKDDLKGLASREAIDEDDRNPWVDRKDADYPTVAEVNARRYALVRYTKGKVDGFRALTHHNRQQYVQFNSCIAHDAHWNAPPPTKRKDSALIAAAAAEKENHAMRKALLDISDAVAQKTGEALEAAIGDALNKTSAYWA